MHDLGHAERGEHGAGTQPERRACGDERSTVSGSTGSAPLSAMRSGDRSRPARRVRSARVASTHEKFGPAVAVPPKCRQPLAASGSGAPGSPAGAPSTSVACRWSSAASANPTSPMSWYSGSHDTSTSSSASSSAAVATASRLAQIVRCGSITPFGSRRRAAGELQDGERVGIVARVARSPVVAAADSVGSSSSSSTIGGSPGRGSMNGGEVGVDDERGRRRRCAIRARVWATNSSIDPSRIGSGSTTSVAPHSQIGLDGGDQRPGRRAEQGDVAPGPMPRAWSAAATARASSCSWPPRTRGPASSPVTKVIVRPRPRPRPLRFAPRGSTCCDARGARPVTDRDPPAGVTLGDAWSDDDVHQLGRTGDRPYAARPPSSCSCTRSEASASARRRRRRCRRHLECGRGPCR